MMAVLVMHALELKYQLVLSLCNSDASSATTRDTRFGLLAQFPDIEVVCIANVCHLVRFNRYPIISAHDTLLLCQ